MTSNCTDSSNEQYEIYWFDYFVSIGYIDNSDLVNLYAPYGKCTRTLLWITYLINIVHFFLLSSGILYVLILHRSKSNFKVIMLLIIFRSKWILVAIYYLAFIIYLSCFIDCSICISE